MNLGSYRDISGTSVTSSLLKHVSLSIARIKILEKMHFSSDPVSLLSKKCKVYSSTYTTTFFIIDDSDIQ